MGCRSVSYFPDRAGGGPGENETDPEQWVYDRPEYLARSSAGEEAPPVACETLNSLQTVLGWVGNSLQQTKLGE